MRLNQNICKFINTTERSEQISIKNFVYEKNQSANAAKELLPHYKICLVTQGKGKLLIQNQTHELAAGNIFFTFKQLPVQIQNTQDLQYLYISFDGSRIEELFARFGISPANCIFEEHRGLTAFWENSLVKASEKNLDLISEAVLLYTLGEMVERKIEAKETLINDFVKFIEENFHNSELNLNTACEHFGYNSKYISHLFKERMSITFSAYLTNVRLKHAVFLMEQNVTSIKNIALLCGYKDPLYFSNVFKSKMGTSPKEYISYLRSN